MFHDGIDGWISNCIMNWTKIWRYRLYKCKLIRSRICCRRRNDHFLIFLFVDLIRIYVATSRVELILIFVFSPFVTFQITINHIETRQTFFFKATKIDWTNAVVMVFGCYALRIVTPFFIAEQNRSINVYFHSLISFVCTE